MGSALAGASILEVAWHRAAWARALAPTTSSQLFDIEKVCRGSLLRAGVGSSRDQFHAAIFVNSTTCWWSRLLQALGRGIVDRPDQGGDYASPGALRGEYPLSLGSHQGKPGLPRNRRQD